MSMYAEGNIHAYISTWLCSRNKIAINVVVLQRRRHAVFSFLWGHVARRNFLDECKLGSYEGTSVFSLLFGKEKKHEHVAWLSFLNNVCPDEVGLVIRVSWSCNNEGPRAVISLLEKRNEHVARPSFLKKWKSRRSGSSRQVICPGARWMAHSRLFSFVVVLSDKPCPGSKWSPSLWSLTVSLLDEESFCRQGRIQYLTPACFDERAISWSKVCGSNCRKVPLGQWARSLAAGTWRDSSAAASTGSSDKTDCGESS